MCAAGPALRRRFTNHRCIGSESCRGLTVDLMEATRALWCLRLERALRRGEGVYVQDDDFVFRNLPQQEPYHLCAILFLLCCPHVGEHFHHGDGRYVGVMKVVGATGRAKAARENRVVKDQQRKHMEQNHCTGHSGRSFACCLLTWRSTTATLTLWPMAFPATTGGLGPEMSGGNDPCPAQHCFRSRTIVDGSMSESGHREEPS